MFGIKRKAAIDDQNILIGNIRFSQDLIEELVLQQSEIYSSHKELIVAVRSHSMDIIESKMIQFKRDFQTHMVNKKVKLYAYLKNELDLSVTQAHIINKARLTGSEVSKTVNQFLGKYLTNNALELSEDQLNEFNDELKDLGVLMVASMREERDCVFPLYRSVKSSI